MYQAAQVCKITDIKPKRLAQLQERGTIKATVEASGQGTRREYDEGGVAAILLTERLAKGGFSHREASKIAFDKRVTDLLTEQIRTFMRWGNGDVIKAFINRDRVVLLIAVRKFGGEIDIRFVDDSEKLAAEFTTLVKAELSHVVNLTEIALEVAERLTPKILR